MSIVVYHGLPGSGKTYEVVSEVILPAVMAGRRVVTNIRGLNLEKIRAYVLEKTKLDLVELRIVSVSNADIDADNFLYYEVEHRGGTPTPAPDTVTKAGDLVVIDEAWRFWSVDNAIRANHQTFFRMHRQYVETSTGNTCDLVIITQDIGDVNRKVRRVVERNFRTRKLSELGTDRRYTVFQHEQSKTTQLSLIRRWVKKYDPEVYALYESYSSGQGNEQAVDARRSLFHGSAFKWRIVMLLGSLALVGWLLWGLFFPKVGDVAKGKGGKDVKAKSVAGSDKGGGASGSGGAGPGGASGLAGSLIGSGGKPAPEPPVWRQVGYFSRGSQFVIVLISDAGVYRYEYEPQGYKLGGRLDYSAIVDGKGVTTWGAGGLQLPKGSKPGEKSK